MPRSGDVLHLGKAASVQFAAPILLRLIRVHDWDTYIGWVWLDGYQLNERGDAVERRTVWVQIAGIRHVGEAPDPRTRTTAARKARNVARVPRPRTAPTTTSASLGRAR